MAAVGHVLILYERFKEVRLEVNAKKDPNCIVFELACHEVNYTMNHMRSGFRALEKRAEAATTAR